MSDTAVNNSTEEIDELFKKALAKHQAGAVTEAGPLYIDVLNLDPYHPAANNNIALLLIDIGRPADAIPHFERVLTRKPNNTAVLNNLGNALRGLGRLEQAYDTYSQALEQTPENAEIHNNLGAVRSAQNRDSEAVVHYQKAVEIKPDYPEAQNNLGNALQSVGNIPDAITHYRAAIGLREDYFGAHANLGIALQAAGKENEAIGHFEKALSLRPNATAVHRHLALLAPDRAQVDKIEELLVQPELSEDDRTNLHFAMGTVLRAQDKHSQAFEHFEKANQSVRKSIDYNHDQHVEFINRIIDTFPPEFFRGKAELGVKSDLPVFIVGMPRSGTTLVEHILSSHPNIHGGGELEFFADLKNVLPHSAKTNLAYPEDVVALGQNEIQSMSGRYLEELKNLSSDAVRITNKMPVNFISLGLIQLLFPGTRIIHCRREPMDTCVSIYFQYFTGHHPYAYDLKELGLYYEQYERLMAHWNEVFPVPMLTIQYEDLIENQEAISRQMIEFLGLEWDDRCLEFYKNTRPVRSASNMQVRKPLYTSSINQWKLYEDHLKPLIEALSA